MFITKRKWKDVSFLAESLWHGILQECLNWSPPYIISLSSPPHSDISAPHSGISVACLQTITSSAYLTGWKYKPCMLAFKALHPWPLPTLLALCCSPPPAVAHPDGSPMMVTAVSCLCTQHSWRCNTLFWYPTKGCNANHYRNSAQPALSCLTVIMRLPQPSDCELLKNSGLVQWLIQLRGFNMQHSAQPNVDAGDVQWASMGSGVRLPEFQLELCHSLAVQVNATLLCLGFLICKVYQPSKIDWLCVRTYFCLILILSSSIIEWYIWCIEVANI